MQSPFPGMDPFIESPKLWSDFHNNLASEIQAQLNVSTAPRYYARLTPYLTYESIMVTQSETFSIHPDVGVFQPQPDVPAAGATVLDAAPAQSEITLEFELELFSIEIRDAEHQALVTAIEILSPVNKRPSHDAYHDYLRKRRDVLRSTTHFVEIDLLRGGTRPPLNKPVPVAPCYVSLSRANRRPKVDVWPVPLQSRLPIIPIPLRPPDADVPLDLGVAVRAVYQRGAYFAQIKYTDPVPPPLLSDEDAAWVQHLLGHT